MPEVLAYDTPIRPIQPGHKKPAPAESPAGAPPARTAFRREWLRILAGLIAR